MVKKGVPCRPEYPLEIYVKIYLYLRMSQGVSVKDKVQGSRNKDETKTGFLTAFEMTREADPEGLHYSLFIIYKLIVHDL
jgi:hypothetical protein